MNDDALAADLALVVVRLARRLRLRQQTSTLTLSQYSVLSTLHHYGPLTPGTLAARERVRAPSMTRALDNLAAADMITRSPHPTDGRQIIVTLTQAGIDTVDRAAIDREQWLTQQLAQLGPAHVAVAANTTRIINIVLGDTE